MEENIFKIVENINQLKQRAYVTYLPLVQSECYREASQVNAFTMSLKKWIEVTDAIA